MFQNSSGSRILMALVVAAAAVAATGCSGQSSSSAPSPVGSPSAGPTAAAPASGSATISGTVVGTTTASLVKTMGAAMTVTVTGSNASATVDGSGHFTLNNVPSGHVELHFTGRDVDAVLGLDGVAEGDTVVITVRVSGHDANLEHEDHGPNPQGQVEVNGLIAAGSLGGSCAAHSLSFMVGTTKITTNASTQFRAAPCESLKAGIHVELKGTRQTDGSVLAATIEGDGEAKNPNDDGNGGSDNNQNDGKGVDVEGKIAAGSLAGSCSAHTLSFKVGTTVVKTNASTQFKDTACTSLAAGSSVEVKGTRQTDSSVLASSVEGKS